MAHGEWIGWRLCFSRGCDVYLMVPPRFISLVLGCMRVHVCATFDLQASDMTPHQSA